MDIKEIIEDAKEAGILLTGKPLRDSPAKRNLTLVITLQELTKFTELRARRKSEVVASEPVLEILTNGSVRWLQVNNFPKGTKLYVATTPTYTTNRIAELEAQLAIAVEALEKANKYANSVVSVSNITSHALSKIRKIGE